MSDILLLLLLIPCFIIITKLMTDNIQNYKFMGKSDNILIIKNMNIDRVNMHSIF